MSLTKLTNFLNSRELVKGIPYKEGRREYIVVLLKVESKLKNSLLIYFLKKFLKIAKEQSFMRDAKKNEFFYQIDAVIK